MINSIKIRIEKFNKLYNGSKRARFFIWLNIFFICIVLAFFLEIVVFNFGRFRTNRLDSLDKLKVNYEYLHINGDGEMVPEDDHDAKIIYTLEEPAYIHKIKFKTTVYSGNGIEYAVFVPEEYTVLDSVFHAEFFNTEETMVIDKTVSLFYISVYDAKNTRFNIELVDLDYGYDINPIRLIGTFLSLMTFFYCLIQIIDKRRFKIEKVALCLILVFGTLYAFLIPPSYSWDEYAHFLRAITMSQGHFIVTKATEALYPFNIEALANYDYRTLDDFYAYLNLAQVQSGMEPLQRLISSSADTYIFIPYIFSGFGALIAQLLGLSVYYMSAFARMGNVLVYALLVYLALKYIPCYKNLIFFLAMIPNTIFLAASSGTGPLQNGCLLLALAFLAYSIKSREKVSGSMYFLIIFLLVIVTICRMTYGFFIMLVILIPAKKFKNKTLGRYNWLISMIIMVITMVIVYFYSSLIGMTSFDHEGVDMAVQLSNIIHYPLTYLKRVWMYSSLEIFTPELGREIINTAYVGSIPDIYGMISLILVMILTLSNNPKTLVFDNWWSRIVILGLSVLAYMATCTAMYVTFNAVNSLTISGLQGRYIFAILMVLLPICESRKFYLRCDQQKVTAFTILYSLLMMVLLLGTMIYHFYK